MAVPKGTQFLGEGMIADTIDAISEARRWRQMRSLARKELLIGQKVFGRTIPWDRVMVTDGLGANARPFTMPVPMTSPRKYALHVGPNGYYGMSFRKHDAELLVHELVHVWQGQSSRWSWQYVFSSGWHQATSNDAYAYDKSRDALAKGDWDKYNPEQQASIVEDWFSDGMPGEPYDPALSFMDSWFVDFRKKEYEEDPRYRFIVTGIRGEAMPVKLQSREELSIKSSSVGYLDAAPVSDDFVAEWMAKRYAPNDVAGYKRRIEVLRSAFRDLSPDRAKKYIERLTQRRAGDKVAMHFQAHLAGYERKILMDTLQARAVGRRI